MPRTAPKWVTRVCAEFGSDPLYNQPRYRVIWGPDREEIRYGVVCKRYDDVDPRWILEVFVPHEKYGFWDEESMGPRPSGGEYFLSQVIQIDGEYIPLGDYGRDTLKLLILCVEKGKALSEWEKKTWRDAQTAKREAAAHQKFSDLYDEVTGPFDDNAVSGIPGKRRSDDVILGDMAKLTPELQKRLARRAGEFTQL